MFLLSVKLIINFMKIKQLYVYFVGGLNMFVFVNMFYFLRGVQFVKKIKIIVKSNLFGMGNLFVQYDLNYIFENVFCYLIVVNIEFFCVYMVFGFLLEGNLK